MRWHVEVSGLPLNVRYCTNICRTKIVKVSSFRDIYVILGRIVVGPSMYNYMTIVFSGSTTSSWLAHKPKIADVFPQHPPRQPWTKLPKRENLLS